MTTLFDLRDAKWASEECDRQRSGELSVGRLLESLEYTRFTAAANARPTAEAIQTMGIYVEPDLNTAGWRRTEVTVGVYTPPHHTNLDRLMPQLIGAWAELDPDDWYREFEMIHPFTDGNGRVGSLLWNWHRRTLNTPIHPPDFFDSEWFRPG